MDTTCTIKYIVLKKNKKPMPFPSTIPNTLLSFAKKKQNDLSQRFQSDI